MNTNSFYKYFVLAALLGVFAVFAGCDDDSSNNGTGACDGYDCGHGDCNETDGIAFCTCDTGYTGVHCTSCDTGYIPSGDECIEASNDPLYGTPNIDGTITEAEGDWSVDQHVGDNAEASDWGDNVLSALYVAYDTNNLYIGVQGFAESTNSIVVYIDTDYGTTSAGLSSIAAATDNDGAIDNSMSANITVTDSSFKVDWAVGTKGMGSAPGTLVDEAGWRNIGLDGTNFPWVSAQLVAGSQGFEASIPLTELFGGTYPEGTQIALFARLMNEDGQYFSNQTLPGDNASTPSTVSELVVISLPGGGNPVCNHDGNCDAGETTANCADDCPPVCNNDGNCDAGETIQNCPGDCSGATECGDPDVFQWEDSVMYFVLVDRFFDSDGSNSPVDNATWEAQYMGGDWQGVEQKLAYLEDLGVNTVWLSAPYNNREYAGAAIDPGSDSHLYSAYHGYWPSPGNIDYSDPDNPVPVPAVESRLGSSADLQSLIDTLHTDGMYVLFDYVMNHVDIASDLYANHAGWFYNEEGNIIMCPPDNWNDPYYSTRCAFTDYLPAFDFYNPDARAWSINDAVWWAKEFDIDGYRLDAIKHVPMDWLTELRTRLNSEFTDPTGGRFYLVGETYDFDSQQTLKDFIDPNTKLDGQFDFPMRKRLCDTVFNYSMDFNAFFSWMDGNDSFYSADTLMSTWVGNHDIPRAIHFASGQITDCYTGSNVGNSWNPGSYDQPWDIEPYERLALAFGIMLTNRGVPLIYYGDEIGLAGGGDPDNRRMMQWDGYSSNQLWLQDRVRTLLNIRNSNVVLRRGYRITLSTGQDTYAYKMIGCGAEEDLFVMVNRAGQANQVTGLPAGSYTELISGTTVAGGTTVEVPPRGIMIFKAQ
ncbi:hypothetical protein KKF84_01875 [Myxococcota bacterium]|nr:hypothetical protein [Myxococcota bacterium]MBU1534034.1 hypothetical protein [Myxococcota bacterium]